jgi:hypothetical protein
MLFFVKSTVKTHIINFDSLIIKTGLMGTMGNKGSCLLRFNYLDTSIALSTGHFAAGASSNQSRISELNDVLNKNFPVFKKSLFKEHDVYIVFGDMNFRCEIDYGNCIDLIRINNLDMLAKTDQFLKCRHLYHNFNEIKEGKLDFRPTYKYVIGTSDYDEKKKRVPSWCDRVFYKRGNYIKQLVYDRSEISYSDHKPVYSIFKIQAFKELKEEKAKLIKEIKANMMLGLKNSGVFDSPQASKENLEFNVKNHEITDFFK